MYHLRLKSHFDAAHFLRCYEGKCSKLHGHRWHVQLELSGTRLNGAGILIDFGDIKRILAEVLPDHCCLNDLEAFKTVNPTAENLSKWLFAEIAAAIHCNFPHLCLNEVEVYESEDASAIARLEDFDWRALAEIGASCAEKRAAVR